MKGYTLASDYRFCHGHGDYSTEQIIQREGSYGSGYFPPIFKTREAAEEYKAKSERPLNCQFLCNIVEIELVGFD